LRVASLARQTAVGVELSKAIEGASRGKHNGLLNLAFHVGEDRVLSRIGDGSRISHGA
jgi:hypothetical protein